MTKSEYIEKNIINETTFIMEYGTKSCSHCMFWNKILTANTPNDVKIHYVDIEADENVRSFINGDHLPIIDVYKNNILINTFIGQPTKENKDLFCAIINN